MTHLSDFVALDHWNNWRDFSLVILHALQIYTYGIDLCQHE